MKPTLPQIVSQFQIEGELVEIKPYGSGHINSTFLVQLSQGAGREQGLILQRINQHVFTEPEKVMANIGRVTAHLCQKIVKDGGDPSREALTFLPTKNGRFYHKTSSGDYWRMELFIEGAKTYQHAPSLQHYYEAAYAYGRFQSLLADFPVNELYETIPHFHHTVKRLVAFETAVAQDSAKRASTVTEEISFIRERTDMAPVLTTLQETGQIPLRVTHNDTKFDNVMIDIQTGKGVCVIDLDTVMPGIAMFDFADAVRSGANLAAEDESETDKVTFSLEIYARLAHGFLDATHHNLTPLEIDHLAFAARLITYEQAMRFLTDYMNGDRYYKTDHPQHNLDRCRTQIRLLQLMEASQVEMAEIIETYRD
ncbi:MAG: aminoglycoside phosphotransferase family protein [Anaerolineae bacterium]|nr:aminoglycoside phosphotransferase family protein [Anaerolineae bacterium]